MRQIIYWNKMKSILWISWILQFIIKHRKPMFENMVYTLQISASSYKELISIFIVYSKILALKRKDIKDIYFASYFNYINYI